LAAPKLRGYFCGGLFVAPICQSHLVCRQADSLAANPESESRLAQMLPNRLSCAEPQAFCDAFTRTTFVKIHAAQVFGAVIQSAGH
jgi:hypothetical protein